MNKYLYPIKKLNIKSWIKYWLLKVKASKFAYKVSEVFSGTFITINNTIRKEFVKFLLFGNSVQDGENEVPINSCGDNVNLFDKDNANILNANIGNNKVTASDNAKTLYISCKANTTYTISRKAGARFRVGYTSTLPAPNVSVDEIITDETASSITITTNSTAQYLVVYYYLSGTDTLTETEIRNSIKIEQGSTATPYSPYGQGVITEKVVNKNLFDVTGFEQQLVAGKIINDSGAEVNDSTSQYSKYFLYLQKNKTYYIKGAWQRIYFYDKNKNFKSRSTAGTGLDRSYTPTEDEFIRFQISTTYWNSNKGQEQVELGSTAINYVPHQEQIYPIYTQQPMRSIGDVRDVFVKKTDNNWYERHNIIFIANYNNEELPSDVYTEDGEIKYCNSKSMSTTGQFSVGASVQYITSESTDLLCTAEQTEQLESLLQAKSYNGQTNIYSEDIVSPYLEIQGYVKESD